MESKMLRSYLYNLNEYEALKLLINHLSLKIGETSNIELMLKYHQRIDIAQERIKILWHVLYAADPGEKIQNAESWLKDEPTSNNTAQNSWPD